MRTVEVYTPEQLTHSAIVEQFTLGQYTVLMMRMEYLIPVRYYIKLERTTQWAHRRRLAMLSKSDVELQNIQFLYDRLVNKIKANQHAEITL